MTDTLASRIRSLAPHHGDMSRLARSAQLKQRTVANWAAGQGKPDVESAAHLADAAGVNLQWLASGRGPKFVVESLRPSPTLHNIDETLLIEVVEAIDEALAQARIKLQPAGLAKVIAAAYDEAIDERSTPQSDRIRRYLRLVS